MGLFRAFEDENDELRKDYEDLKRELESGYSSRAETAEGHKKKDVRLKAQ